MAVHIAPKRGNRGKRSEKPRAGKPLAAQTTGAAFAASVGLRRTSSLAASRCGQTCNKEPLGNDADFVAAINVGNLHKAVTKAAADKQELINLRADLNDPKDGLDLLNEAEKLICKAKGQINRAGCHDSVGGPSDN